MNMVVIVLSALVATAFVGSGAVKLAGAKQSLQIRDQLGVDAALWRLIGALEIAGAVGLALGLILRGLGSVAAAALGLLMAGAIATHARAGDLRHSAPAAILLALAVAIVAIRLTALPG